MSRAVACLCVLVATLVTAAADAATILYRTNEQLVASSERIVHGRVIDVRAVRETGGGRRIYTVTTLAVIEDLTGGADETIEVWELGGTIGDETLVVIGAVHHQEGDEILVLLERGPRGLRSMSMGLSTFDVRRVSADDGLLTRRTGESVVLGAPTQGDQQPRLSDFRRMAIQLKGSAPRRFANLEQLRSRDRRQEPFTTLSDARWIQADSGTPVPWFRNTIRPSPLFSGSTDNEINVALAAWTNPTGGSIILQHAGSTSLADPIDGVPSNVGVITFDDPLDDVSNSGGVLAVGGVWFFGPGTGGTFNGRSWRRIDAGFVVLQSTAALPANFRAVPDFTRVLQHEIGHGIGFGHSESDGNIMFASCCSGATPVPPNLGPDDLAVLNFVYPGAATPPPPPPPPACTFSISPTSAFAPAAGGTATIALSASAPTCAWTASSSASFLSLFPTSGTGSATVSYTVASNTSTADRSGTLTIAGRTFTVTQFGIPPALDLNGDRKLDLLWHHQTTGQIAGWLMNDLTLIDGTLLTPSSVPDTNWKLVGSGDLDADGHFDLVWQNIADGRTSAWLMNGLSMREGTLFSIPQVPDTDWRIRSVGDLNSDGRADLFWQHQTNGQIAVWLMNGVTVIDGTLLTPSSVSDLNWKIVGTADFDGNGSRDLVWHHQGDGNIAIWFMNGTSLMSGALTNPAQVPDLDWKIRAVGDLNNDGRPDLLWQNIADGRTSVWLMNGLNMVAGTLLTPSQVADTNWHIVGPR